MNFEEYLNESIEFEKDPHPHIIEPTQGRFGKSIYHVRNRHDWRRTNLGTHDSIHAAQAHIDELNKAHREKHKVQLHSTQ